MLKKYFRILAMSHIETHTAADQSYIQNAWVSKIGAKIKWKLIEILNQPMITEYGITQILLSTTKTKLDDKRFCFRFSG